MHNEQKVTKSVYWIESNDFITPRFDNYIPLKRGISYNSYFIDDEKTCILDAVDNAARDLFLGNVKELLHDRPLDYIIVNHMEPDHSGSLLELAKRYPEAKICATPAALKMFEQYFHEPMAERYIRTNEKLVIDLGHHKLRFIPAPMVHWPEVTFTYEETEKILFSADAFGTFGVLHGSVFSDDTDYEEEYLEEARRYYMNVIAKYGAQVLRTLQKTENLDVSMVCPLHGPVHRTEADISRIMNLYRQLASWMPEYRSAAVCFASAYGNTAFAAQRLTFFLGQKGIRHLKLIDLCTIPVSYAWAEAMRRSHLVLAAPTLNMDLHPMMQNFLHECSVMGLQNRTVSVIGNSSWVPDISVKKITETAVGWKNCTILGDAVNIASAVGAKEDRELEVLAGILAQDILK